MVDEAVAREKSIEEQLAREKRIVGHAAGPMLSSRSDAAQEINDEIMRCRSALAACMQAKSVKAGQLGPAIGSPRRASNPYCR